MITFIHRYGLMFIPISCFVLFSIVFLTVYPIPWPDEAHLGDPAVQLSTKGTLSSSLLLGQEKHVYWVPPGYSYPLSVFFSFFGCGLEQQRVFSLLFGCGILILAYAIALHISENKWAAFVASLLILADPFFLRYAKIGRMESLAVFFVLLAVYLLLRFCTHQSSRTLFLVGFFAACAGFYSPLRFSCYYCNYFWIVSMGSTNLSLKNGLFLLSPPIVSLAVWVFYGLADLESFRLQLLWQWERMARKDVFVHVGKFLNAYRFIPLILFVQIVSMVAAISGKIRTHSLSFTRYIGACGLIFLIAALRTAEPQHTLFFLPFCAIVLHYSY